MVCGLCYCMEEIYVCWGGFVYVGFVLNDDGKP